MSAQIPTIPIAQMSTSIASFAPIQKNDAESQTKEVQEPEPEEKAELKQASPSSESKPTVTIPIRATDEPQKQPETPTVTSATPPHSPASASTQSKPLTATKDLSAVHDIPDTPPAGQKEKPKPKKETPKKKN